MMVPHRGGIPGGATQAGDQQRVPAVLENARDRLAAIEDDLVLSYHLCQLLKPIICWDMSTATARLALKARWAAAFTTSVTCSAVSGR